MKEVSIGIDVVEEVEKGGLEKGELEKGEEQTFIVEVDNIPMKQIVDIHRR